MKNLLVFTSTFPTFLENDGTPPFVYELSKRLAKDKNLNVSVLTPFRKGTKTFEKRDELKIYRYKYGFTSLCESAILPNLRKNKLLFIQVPFFLFFGFMNLAKIIKNEKIDIIYAAWIIPQGFLSVLYKVIFKKKNLKIVCTSYGADIFALQYTLVKKIKKWTLNRVNKLVVLTNAMKKEVEKLNVRKKLSIEIIPLGVDENLFNPDKYDEEIKEKYNIKGPFLLFVGRLVEKKGCKYLIKAMPEIIQKYRETKLLIIGSGPLEQELKKLVKDLNLGENIIFTGPIPNYKLPRYYATADIFIGPSVIEKSGDREGLPSVYLEALASGCIVIASDLPGNKELIKDGINGYLVRQRNSKDIADKILKILENKNKINREKNLDFIRENYSWNIISKKFLEIF